MKENHLIVPRTARYHTLGQWTPHTRQVWFVLHGYGQLTQYFIKKFETLDNDQTAVIAPEALSKFYLNEPGSSRVGASWMTREDRQHEIADQLNYLNLLYDTLRPETCHKDLKINLLGFSQGTATALRWVANGGVQFGKVVLWAGYFAKGIGDLIQPAQLQNIETVIAYGTRDEYLSQIDMEAYMADVRQHIPHAQMVSFDGLHTIDVPTLLKISSE